MQEEDNKHRNLIILHAMLLEEQTYIHTHMWERIKQIKKSTTGGHAAE